MDWIAYFVCLLLVNAVGYALLCSTVGGQKLNAPLLVGLSWALGAGMIGIVLFALSLLGRVPDRTALLLVIAITTIAIVIAFRRRSITFCEWHAISRPAGWTGRILTIAAIALVIAAVGSVAMESTMPGLPDTDAFAIWTLKAKLVAAEPLRPIPVLLTDPTLSFSHQDYPLGLPLLTAAVHAATNWPVEACGQSLLLPIFVALVLVTYGSLRVVVNSPLAMGLTAAFVAGPSLGSLAGTTEAELPLLLLHTASLSLLLLWMKRGKRGWLLAAGAAAAFAAFIKNEGLALLPILVFAAAGLAGLERSLRRLRDVGWAAVVALLVISPWLIYRTHLPHTHEDYGGRLAHVAGVIGHLDRLTQIGRTFLSQPLRFGAVGGFWLLLPVCVVLGWRASRQSAVLSFGFVVLAHAGLYVLVFMVTPWDLGSLLPMVSPKLMMHVSPAALLLMGLYAGAIAEGDSASFLSPRKVTKTPAMSGSQQ